MSKYSSRAWRITVSFLIGLLSGVFFYGWIAHGSILFLKKSIFSDLAPNRSTTEKIRSEPVYTIASARAMGNEINGEVINVTGYVCGSSMGDALIKTDPLSDSEIGLRLPRGWFVEIEPGVWSQKVVIKGRFDYFSTEPEFDTLYPVSSIEIIGG